MRTRPPGLADDVLAGALADGWGLRLSAMAYLPVGAGSHHWRVSDGRGGTWFVTVDDLDARRDDPTESRAAVSARLDAAIATAYALSVAGAEFVVAPVEARTGAVLERFADRWAVAVYPFIDGETFHGGDRRPMADRLAVVDMVARLHGIGVPAGAPARADDYQLQNRADLESAIAQPQPQPQPQREPMPSPYTERLATILRSHGDLVRGMLGEYDELVAGARERQERVVLTHGEPHAGNTMRTSTGWKLIDWDTARVAAPERDMWMLDTGDGEAAAAYTAVTGVELVPELLTLFRLRWDLADLGVDIAEVTRAREASADAQRALDGVSEILERHRRGDVVPHAAWR